LQILVSSETQSSWLLKSEVNSSTWCCKSSVNHLSTVFVKDHIVKIYVFILCELTLINFYQNVSIDQLIEIILDFVCELSHDRFDCWKINTLLISNKFAFSLGDLQTKIMPIRIVLPSRWWYVLWQVIGCHLEIASSTRGKKPSACHDCLSLQMQVQIKYMSW
jgi:hypothetical protein